MLEKFIPRLRVNTVYDIDLEALYAQGYRGIITDLDNTLVGAKEPHATPELVAWLETAKQAGFQVVIVSNNDEGRVSLFTKPLGIPFVHAARKPRRKPFRKALSLMNLSAAQTVVIGDQMLTDVFGGNRTGLYTILVLPIAAADEGVMTQFNRRMEKVILRRLRKKGLWHEEEQR
ncbi:hypothetical protein BVG16_10785 [Paenibacillus selenitireducens]|uniref:HAD family hydrolase n=1 Tax=Paenibacillus selenitireducens TaxID=1324314 RepID=A0A1T2XEQ8_9BACL|nr:YqeG family HAD IIIA-type phosphatase [Paenibacillus selenitireducens]OPA78361.1 hypothetical protein BVG16_10785 [Paenibacillus selenitireducens]